MINDEDIVRLFNYNQHFVAMMNIINKAWNANLRGNSYKEHYNIDEIRKSYYEYKLTMKFPISWNCYQSFYHRGEI